MLKRRGGGEQGVVEDVTVFPALQRLFPRVKWPVLGKAQVWRHPSMPAMHLELYPV